MSFLDDDDQADGEREEILRRARSEGLHAAYVGALDLIQDRKAPAQARAAAMRLVAQLAGALDSPEPPDPGKGLAEMDGAELASALASSRARLAALEARASPEGARGEAPLESVFD